MARRPPHHCRRLHQLVAQLHTPAPPETPQKIASSTVCEDAPQNAGASAVTITKIKAIRVAPYGTPLCIVKIETSAGVHGIGCATFTQRHASAGLAALAFNPSEPVSSNHSACLLPPSALKDKLGCG